MPLPLLLFLWLDIDDEAYGTLESRDGRNQDPCIIVWNKATYQPGYLLLTIMSEKNKPSLHLSHYTCLTLLLLQPHLI